MAFPVFTSANAMLLTASAAANFGLGCHSACSLHHVGRLTSLCLLLQVALLPAGRVS